MFEGHELCHVHPDRRTLDLPLPDDRRAQLLDAGRDGGYWRRPYDLHSTLVYTGVLGLPEAHRRTLR